MVDITRDQYNQIYNNKTAAQQATLDAAAKSSKLNITDSPTSSSTVVQSTSSNPTANATFNPNAVLTNGVPQDAGDTPTAPLATNTSTTSTIPAATVATKDNPLVSKPNTSTSTSYTPQDFSHLENMNLSQLQDAADYYAVQQGKRQLTDQEQLDLRKISRLMQSQAAPQDPSTVYDAKIATKQAEEDAKKAELQNQDATTLDLYKQQQDTSYAQQETDAKAAGQRKLDAAQGILSFSGFGRSTEAAKQQSTIQGEIENSVKLLEEKKAAENHAKELELAGATKEALAPLQKYIDDLGAKSADAVSSFIEKTNEYNQANAKSYQEKIDNILKAAQSAGATYDKLTPEQKVQVDTYSKLALKDGNINEDFMATIPAALKFAVMEKAALAAGAYNDKGTFTTTADPIYGGFITTNTKTGEVNRASGGDAGEGLGSGTISNNSNPAFGTNTGEIGLSYNNPGAIKTQGDAGKSGTGFAIYSTPQTGFEALKSDIAAKQKGGPNIPAGSTLLQMMNMYASSPGDNPESYAQGLAQKLGVTVDTPISKIDNTQLALAIAQHESPKFYQSFLAGGNGSTTDGNFNPNYKDLYNEYSKSPSTFDIKKLAGYPGLTLPALAAQATAYKNTQPNTENDTAKTITSLVDELMTSPGKRGVVGFHPIFNTVPQLFAGTNSATFKSKYDQLKNILALPNLQLLKGSMSDKDLLFLTNIGTSLNTNMKPEDFDKELQKIKDHFSGAGNTSPGATPENAESKSASGKAIIFRNGQREYK